jgi:hypothetical protein
MKKFIKTRIYGFLGNVKTIRMVNQPEIIDYIKNNPGQSENQIMYDVYGYDRNSTWESNKKYADCLRRALHSGKIRREEIKGRSYKFIYFINDLPKVEPKKDNVYLSKLKSKDMNNSIKIEGKLEMINLSAPVEVGELKANLIAQVIVVKGKIDCIEFVDIEKPTYRGIEISDWKKFVNMNKEWGMDYNKVLNEKFDEIFEESVVKEILGLGN